MKGGDPSAMRAMEQSMARYNEEQSANAVAQRQAFIHQMNANHLTLLRQQEEAATASFLEQVAAIERILKQQS